MEESTGTRINKYLSEIGFCSRREADKLIEQGRVTINGSIPKIGAKVGRRDKVKVDGRLVSGEYEEAIYLAFNKPVGIVSTTDTQGERDNIISYINYPKRIFPIGRLDKESEGLIFLTSDGDIVNKILRAGNNHEKEYIVTVNKPINEEFVQKMSNGIPILGTMTKKCKVTQVGPSTFSIILIQGLNRQIRRMCEFLGYEVQKLKRVRIMNITLDVPLGEWRDLTPKELEEINRMVAESSKTEEASGKPGNKAKSPGAPPKKNNQARPQSGSNPDNRRKKGSVAGQKKFSSNDRNRSGQKKNKPSSNGKRFTSKGRKR